MGNKDAVISSHSAGHPETWGGVGKAERGAAGLHIRQQMLLLKKLAMCCQDPVPLTHPPPIL